MPVAPVVESYPMSPLQEGMVFHFLEGTNVGVDIEQFVGELGERLDVERLRRAWATVAARHAILRTRFAWLGLDRPEQQVVESIDVPLVVVDGDGVHLDDWLEQDRRAGVALDSAPLWRVTVLAGAASDRLVFTYHHALLDTSVVWCVQEVFEAYDADGRGEAPVVVERRPYREHIEWLDRHLADGGEAAAAYYRALLDGIEEPTRLTALERPSSPEQVTYGADRFRLDPDVSAALHALGASTGTGVPAIVEAAWAVVVSAFAGSTDVVFGSTRGCRRSGLPGSDRIMGLFINTPPVRVALDPSATVRSLVSSVREQQVAKRAHEHTPLADIQAAVGSRGAALFETIVVVNELHQGTRLQQAGPAFAGRRFDLHDQTNFPLTLLAYLDPQIHFKLSFDHRRLDAAGMARVRQLLVAVLVAMAADPDRTVGSLPTVPPVDEATLARWNDTARPYPGDACIHELFEAQVARTPEATALVFRGERLTYRQLDERADEVAAHLRGLGVGPDSLVGVFVERSVEMVAGLLGVLKAGGAYVPMDPAYPSTRIAMMLEDARADVVLTLERLRGSVPGAVPHVVALDRLPARPPSPRVAVPGLRSDHLAYVIFTSGSTGRPKGVMVEHRNVVNFFAGMDDSLGHDPDAVPGTWLSVTSISFDISVLELFWTLTRGVTLVVQEDDRTLARGGAPATAAAPSRPVSFSLFYFSADAAGSSADPVARHDRYRLLIEGARFADEHGFDAVWTPERHFHPFGGLYPNAALTSAAVAMVTSRISIRAGSVVLPLHHPVRAAEDWSVVDNLSNGRVGLSFASGWHANDFVLAPGNFADRRRVMAESIDTVLALWRGESVTMPNGEGTDVAVRMYPPPVQTAPPVWITAGGSPDTFALAGRLGANILTNLLVMGREDLVRNVGVYRQAYRAAGHAGDGHVTVMLHTHVGTDDDEVRRRVREPFLDYLRTSTDLVNQVRWERTSFAKPDVGAPAGGPELGGLDELDDDELAAIMDHAFERYVRSAGLFGTPDTCAATVAELSDLGVDEIACLIDFGLPDADVLTGLTHLDELRRRCVAGPAEAPEDAVVEGETYDLVSQIHRHGVTHLQCTPSHAQLIAATPGGLEALAGLRLLLLGGEALPPAVVDQVRPVLRGRLLNMYGPTETTIWSTVAPVERAGEPITIGRPIANTDIHIVDRALRPLPIGVAGELVIGGEGVVRGYLDRPELTAERFVTLPHTGRRAYRTGDLARWNEQGDIEFGGRLDHQVKIRGYRIELGEIEAAIGRHPGVFEQVVVARTDGGSEPRLVAYVVPSPAADGTDGADAWGQVWDETYRASDADDLTFDVAGWASTYTGEAIDAGEMREWVDHTVTRIVETAPRRVLEIGCGTGLLLFRVAPTCERYVGVDAAASAIERIGRRLTDRPVPGVELVHGTAGAVVSLVDGPFDTVVVNSVAQYFGGADELVEVIRQALSLLRPGGSLFLGDLRSLPLQRHFAAAVELEQAAAERPAADVRERAEARSTGDNELVIDPSLFDQLAASWPEVGDVRLRLKAGRADNEMTRFRYDVVVRRAGDGVGSVPVTLEIAGGSLSPAELRAAVADGADGVRVVGLPNARLVREEQLVARLAVAPEHETAAGLRAALADVHAGIHPDDAVAGARTALGDAYDVDAVWSIAGTDRFDLLVRRRDAAPAPAAASTATTRPWSDFTNRPARRTSASLVPDLRGALRTVLPDFMVPSAFVVLDALPRTPNGKIDRNVLPAPERARSEAAAAAAPTSDLERTIATVWQDMLSLDAVGVETNLFDLGANSLMMVKASVRLAEAIGRPVSLVDLFRYPTVRALAAHLGEGGDEADAEVLRGSQDRAQARRDAMARRRDARAGVRPGRRG